MTAQQSRVRTAPSSLELELPSTREAPGAARVAVRDLFDSRPIDAERLQSLLLLVSEVVSNAVLHARAPTGSTIALRVAVRPKLVRVEVLDRGSGANSPTPRSPSRNEGGLGLFLVDQLAERWGVELESGTRVWFELQLD